MGQVFSYDDSDLARRKKFLHEYEVERENMPPKKLLKLAAGYQDEAQRAGVSILYTYDSVDDMYTVMVDGEKGSVSCTLRRLPSVVHGLYIMGETVRELFWKLQSARKYGRRAKL